MNHLVKSKPIWATCTNPQTRELIETISQNLMPIRVMGTISELKTELLVSQDIPEICIVEINPEDFEKDFWKSTPLELIPNKSLQQAQKIGTSTVLLISNLIGDYDFILSPFTREELSLRIMMLLEKNDPNRLPTQALNGKEIKINPNSLTISMNRETSPTLTSREFQIVNILCNSPGTKIPCKEIMKQVWGKNSVCPKTLHVHIHNLRKKLHPMGMGVLHTPPSGYSLIDRNAHPNVSVTPQVVNSELRRAIV